MKIIIKQQDNNNMYKKKSMDKKRQKLGLFKKRDVVLCVCGTKYVVCEWLPFFFLFTKTVMKTTKNLAI